MKENTYTIFCTGTKGIFSNLAIPLAEIVEPIFEQYDWQEGRLPEVKSLKYDSQPIAGIPGSEIAIGLICMLGTWGIKKFLDELYDLKLKPKIRKVLQSADKVSAAGKSKTFKVFQLSIWHSDIELLVIVNIKGETFENIAKQLDQVSAVHNNALNWIKDHGRIKPIHLYVIENGSVNVAPKEFNSLKEANNQTLSDDTFII